MISTEKIKDKETGGALTEFNMPLLFNFNNGLGFTIQNKNPLKQQT